MRLGAFFSILLLFETSCESALEEEDISGRWYIDQVQNPAGESNNPTFIDCPYFDFKELGFLEVQNGMSMNDSLLRWELIKNKLIIHDFTSNDSFNEFYIKEVNEISMVLVNEDIVLYFSKECSN